MPITTITTPPSRNAGLTQDVYSAQMESTLNTMKSAVDDINANASQYNVATSTTSTSSVLIGTGAKTFTVPAGLGFVIGMTLRIANTSANFMTGEVTSYVGTSLVMNITAVGGSGTLASWNISMAAVGAATAASVSNTPAGNIAATTVQAAINELDTEKLSSAANAVTDTNLSTVATAGTTGDSFNIPAVTITAKGRVSGVTTSAKITTGTVINTTSGLTHDFLSIPAGAKKITLMFNGVSTSGASIPLIQIGSGSFVTTGYAGNGDRFTESASAINVFLGQANTNGFNLTCGPLSGAGAAMRGVGELFHMGGNTWVFRSYVSLADGESGAGTGSLTLSGALDRIRLTTGNGTDTFDAGTFNIFVE
jgi:hypothetical protein